VLDAAPVLVAPPVAVASPVLASPPVGAPVLASPPVVIVAMLAAVVELPPNDEPPVSPPLSPHAARTTAALTAHCNLCTRMPGSSRRRGDPRKQIVAARPADRTHAPRTGRAPPHARPRVRPRERPHQPGIMQNGASTTSSSAGSTTHSASFGTATIRTFSRSVVLT